MSNEHQSRAATFAARFFFWNACVLLIESTLFLGGLILFDPDTVQPLLLHRLGAPDWVVGALRFVQIMGFTLPALIASHYIHGRTHHLKFLISTAAIARIGIYSLPFIIYGFASQRPTFIIVALFLSVALFWLMDSCCAVSWFDIIAKAIPEKKRGRFFGLMQSVTGLAALGAAEVVRRVLPHSFPNNYVLLATGWCICITLSIGCLFLIREPNAEAPDEAKPGIREFIAGAPSLLRRERGLARLITARILLDGSNMALPFYAIFAERDLRRSLAQIGVYGVWKAIGMVSMGPFWGFIGHKWGAAMAFRAVAFSLAMPPLLALPAISGLPWLMPMAFFLMGANKDGFWMTSSNALLQTVSEKDRPLSLGIMSLFGAPGAVAGVLAGLVADKVGFVPVFAFAGMCGLAGWGIALKVTTSAEIA